MGETNDVCVVRLRTTYWSNSKGLYTRRDLVYMKRQSTGFNLLAEDVSAVDAQTTINNITNLHECDDGLYEVVSYNTRRDWESGHADGCDFKLIPFSKKETHEQNPQCVRVPGFEGRVLPTLNEPQQSNQVIKENQELRKSNE